jgi:hypothetical protein
MTQAFFVTSLALHTTFFHPCSKLSLITNTQTTEQKTDIYLLNITVCTQQTFSSTLIRTYDPLHTISATGEN